MKDFRAAVALIDKLLPVAQTGDHHPDLHLTDYRKLRIVLSTHEIGGLSSNDFIMAAKIEALPKKLKAAAHA
jgi:4a-hydroxytetrahydrobiopterin dehydratase